MSTKFICDLFTPEESDVIVFGVPIGKDSKKASISLRKTSDFIETFDLDKKRNLLENVRTCDIGNLELKKLDEITKKTKEILNKNKIPLILGGGHLLTFYVLKAFKDIKLVVFDAHCDLKDEYEDEKIIDLDFVKGVKFNPKLNDATWLRRACEFINPKDVFLIGVRSCDEFEYDFIEKNGISYVTPNQIKDNMKEVKEKLGEFTDNSKIYVSIDMDAFDPSVAPAVHHPEPNGLLSREFSELINTIKGKIMGLDLVCIKPISDNNITEFLATKAVFEILSLLSKP
jgi:agmatinase